MARLSLRPARGFTLIELLVVVLIIGILIAVSAPSFLGQTEKAHHSASKQYLAVTYREAKASATDRDGSFIAGSFDAVSLASAIQASEPALTVSAGSCPGDAVGEPDSHVIVDTAYTTGASLRLCNDPASEVQVLTVQDGGAVQYGAVDYAADGTTVTTVSGDGVSDLQGLVGGGGPQAPSLNSADLTSDGDINNVAVGDTLTFTSDWTGSPTLTYQWMQCPSNNLDGSCSQIVDNTAVYQVLAGDQGKYLNLEVFAENGQGTVEYTANQGANYGPIAAAAAPSYASTVLADNPLGFWRLDETSGTNVANSGTSGSADDGTSGCVTFFNPSSFGSCAQTPTQGVAGATSDGDGALQIHRSGSDSSTVMVPTAADFDTASFSVDGWVYLPTASTAGGLAGNADGGGSGWELSSTGSGAITLYASSRGNVCSKSLLADGWNYVAASWDDTTGTVNCVTANSTFGYTHQTTVIGSSRSTQVQYSGWHFYLGTNPAMSGSLANDGIVIDDLAFYTSALSDATLQAHYAAR